MIERHQPDLTRELQFRAAGCAVVAGLDEAGRGAWAGPVVAGAVILPLGRASLLDDLLGVRDSKLCTARQRARLDARIRQSADTVGVGMVASVDIDRIGIAPATRLAMRLALESLPLTPDALLIDYVHLPEIALPQSSFPKGEQVSLSIAAASIVAKVARDTWMIDHDAEFPDYGFARHKGYGTARHRQAVQEHGPCPIHRLTFAPLRPYLNSDANEHRPGA